MYSKMYIFYLISERVMQRSYIASQNEVGVARVQVHSKVTAQESSVRSSRTSDTCFTENSLEDDNGQMTLSERHRHHYVTFMRNRDMRINKIIKSALFSVHFSLRFFKEKMQGYLSSSIQNCILGNIFSYPLSLEVPYIIHECH